MSVQLDCERCNDAEISKPADFAYDPRRAQRSGPSGADKVPKSVIGRRLLCHEHYEILPKSLREEYVSVEQIQNQDLLIR